MANFPGPPFLLLVLAGSALCQMTTLSPPTQTANISADIAPNSNSSQGTQTATAQPTAQTGPATDINISSSPPRTSLQQHPPDTTSFVQATDRYTAGFSPSTLLPQHQTNTSVKGPGNLNASTSYSSRTTSTMNTTSPALTPSITTEESVIYNCSFDENQDEVHLKIEPDPSTVSYNITFKDTDNQTKPVKNLLIPLDSLKPCRNYVVNFNLACVGNRTSFKTRTLNNSDVIHRLDQPYKNEIHFSTKWDLKFKFGNSIKINGSNSCTNYDLPFEDNDCHNISVPFTLPPEKPVINFINKYPTELQWTNRGNCTENLTYYCKDLDMKPSGRVVRILPGSTEHLSPFCNYLCNGSYDFQKETITSDPIEVRIECDLTNTNKTTVSNSSIHTDWILNSTNCPKISTDTTWSLSCTSKTDKKSGKCVRNHCDIINLEAFTNYACNYEANFKGKQLKLFRINTTTLSAKPIFEKGKLHMIEHNSFKFDCKLTKWNGRPGLFRAVLSDGSSVSSETSDYCSFQLKNLRYSTVYKLKVFAINGGNNSYLIHEESFSTKYNDKALLGFLGFLIVLTSIALLFVLYKIYILKKEKSSRNEQELDDLLPSNALLPVEPISVDTLLEVYKKKRADEGRLFMEEFQSVPRIYSNYSVKEAKKSENQLKNRYVDILPYDYNRVHLSHGERTDYINASFIEGYKETNKYIAAQGPKEETVADFWTMIWEQKTSIIVMVTRCEEGNKNKCAQYWPLVERETEIFDDLVVKIKGEEKYPDYIIRHLTLMNRKEKVAEREVTHIQFTSWPDHGVPSDPGLLLKLRRRVNSFKNFFSGPIVVHCSAGVGRTGTYICIDAMIESLEAEGRVDIYGYVVKLRRQRCLMVQVEAQYVLIHTALIEYSQFGETEIALSDFHSEVNTLRQKDRNDPSLMELEFQKLPKFKNYRSSSAAHTGENKRKNRSSVVPYDFNRVLIKLDDEASHDSEAEDEDEYSSDEDEVPSKYINASYVDGYWMPSSFIVTQGPMAETAADFLHMLYQRKVKTVIMLTNCTENDKEFCSQYWDDKKTFEEMVVKVNETEYTPVYIRRCLEIQHTKRKDSHTLQQYHFLKWAGQELPSNPHDLIDMMRSVRQSRDNSNKNKTLPILVHCSDGSSRSGIFSSLWKLLDSADTEKLVDIFQVAKDLRKARMGMFNTFEQYEFLYAALEAAYPVQNGEVKKPIESPADSVQVINESTALIHLSTDAGTKEATDSVPPAEGATEASSEPQKDLSENTSNGLTSVVEV